MPEPSQSNSAPLSFDDIVDRTHANEFIKKLSLPDGFAKQWVATPADQDLAWEIYTELRTRIATQPLHYMHGKEQAAIKSIYDLFPLVRELIRDKGRDARNTATLALFMINRVVRPFTAKWAGRTRPDQPLHEADGSEFRSELDALQLCSRSFASLLACIAEQHAYFLESESWPTSGGPTAKKGLKSSLGRLPFGIQFHATVPKEVSDEISQAEKEAIIER